MLPTYWNSFSCWLSGQLQELVPERIAKIHTAGTVDGEGGHAGGVEIIEVEAGDTGVLRGRGANAVGRNLHAVTEEAEAEIGKPRGSNGVIDSVGEALIAQAGDAGESRRAEVGAAGEIAESAGSLLAVLLQAVAAEHVDFVGLVAVNADIERVAVHDAAGLRRRNSARSPKRRECWGAGGCSGAPWLGRRFDFEG